MRAAIYARVSTKKDEQNPKTQLLPCRRYCTERGWEIIEEYVDRKTGRNQNRPAYNKMMKEALYRRFDTIVVWKMDRLSRGRIVEVLNILEKLKGYRIEIESITEPYLNTTNPSWELILSVMAWCANMESQRISERVTAGIERWEKEHPGERWRGKQWDIEKAMELRKEGMSWRSIEKELRNDGYDITYAGIRKELLKRGFQKGVNLPSKRS